MKKSFLLGLSIVFLSLLAPVDSAKANTAVEPGLYTAVDVDSETVIAKLVLRADGTLNFKVSAPDFEMPEPGCEGTYSVSGVQFNSHLTCPISILPEVGVQIDITNVNSQSIRSADGVVVPVVIDAFGTDATMFRLKIVE
jgi:hypothetical protein